MIFQGGPYPLSPLDPHKGSPDATVMVIQNLNKMKNTTQGRLNGNKLSPAVQGQLHEIAWCTREIVVQRLACASNPVSGCKDSVGPQITKDRLSHVMAIPWSSDRR